MYYQEGRDSQEILDTVTHRDNDDIEPKIEMTKIPDPVLLFIAPLLLEKN